MNFKNSEVMICFSESQEDNETLKNIILKDSSKRVLLRITKENENLIKERDELKEQLYLLKKELNKL